MLTTSKFRRLAWILAACVALSARTGSADGPTRTSIHTLVHSAHPVPGLPPEQRLTSVGTHGLGESQFALVASFGADTNERGVWRQDSSGITSLVIQAGTPAVGMPSGIFFSPEFWALVPNATNDIVFTGHTTGTLLGRGVWVHRNGSLELIAATNQPVPGLPGRQFSTAESALINDSGHVSLFATLKPVGTGSVTYGVWSEGGGNGLKLLAAEGLDAPQTGGAKFTSVRYLPSINTQGNTAFFATVRTPSNQNRTGIWTGFDYSDLRPIVLQGDAYGGVAGSTFQFVGSNSQLDSAGNIYFNANIYSAATGELSGIWKATSSGLQELVREDTVLPYPTNPAITFTGIGNFVASDDGTIAFSGGLTGPGVHYSDSNEGLWRRAPNGIVSLIAREGDPLPGGAPGEILESFFGLDPSINGLGQVAFLGQFRRPGMTPYIGSAIYAQDLNGVLQMIIRSGDVIDVENGPGVDLRTISNLGFMEMANTSSGGRSGMNDQGQIMFSASFTDGSMGYFVSNLVAVPEMSTAWLFVAGSGPLLLLYQLKRRANKAVRNSSCIHKI
jgi:hypothetical protein